MESPFKNLLLVGLLFVSLLDEYLGVDFLDVRFDVTAMIGSDEKIAQAIEQLRGRIQSGHIWPLRVDIGSYEKRRPFASMCWAPKHKLIVDPFGLVWPCCMLAHPSIRPRRVCLGNLKISTLGEILQYVEQRFPMRHCPNCTPGEASYNLQQENRLQWKALVSTSG